jgi:hypothetical protein
MRLPSLLLVCAAATQLGNTDCGQVLRDSGFDLWCGSGLCAWNVERGSIKKVATWNEGDPGVELVGDDVAIDQLAPVDSGDGSCLEFTLVANVDPSADVELNVDVFGDGSVEHTERIPAANWKPLTYDLPIAGVYRGIRFEITKTGAGKAQLANIGAQVIQNGCAGLTPIVPAPAPLGGACDQTMPATCASGICEVVADPGTWFGSTTACSGCDPTQGCGSGEVCGLHEATSPVYEPSHSCIAQGSKQLGERCDVAAECASNQCVTGVCSACTTSTSCSCAASWTGGPYVCGATSHTAPSGAPCGTDADCASGSCQGTPRGECEVDNRPCATPADCEFGTGSNGPLANGACTIVGVQGGSCR